MLFYAKKLFIQSFLKISILLDFVTKLILKSQRNLPENINKEAIQKTAIPMKNSSKILNMRNIPKKSTFSVLVSFWRGVTKLEAFQWSKVTKLNPPKPSPLVCQLETDNEFKWPLDSSAVRFCYWYCILLILRAFQ